MRVIRALRSVVAFTRKSVTPRALALARSASSSLFEKIIVGIGITDETATYITIKKEKNQWYIIGLNTIPYFSFGISTVIGAIFGNLIPDIFRNSLSFVLYSAFLSLLR